MSSTKHLWFRHRNELSRFCIQRCLPQQRRFPLADTKENHLLLGVCSRSQRITAAQLLLCNKRTNLPPPF